MFLYTDRWTSNAFANTLINSTLIKKKTDNANILNAIAATLLLLGVVLVAKSFHNTN
jgi:hypothetical protein